METILNKISCRLSCAIFTGTVAKTGWGACHCNR